MTTVDLYDWQRITEDQLAATGAYTACPCCGDTVGVTNDGPCIACLEDEGDR